MPPIPGDIACNNLPFGYIEVNGSGEEDYAMMEGHIEARRVFVGPWDSRKQFVQAFLPFSRTVDGNLVVSSPAQYPEFPELVAYKASVEPLLDSSNEGENKQISYRICRITIHYGTPQYEFESGGVISDPENTDFLVEEFQSNVEFLTLPVGAIQYEDGTFDESITYNVRLVTIDYTLHQLFVPQPRFSEITAALGRINSHTFTFPSGNFATPETMLYNGPTGQRRFTIAGSTAWQITHSFTINPVGWNMVYNKKRREFVTSIFDIYGSYDLRRIFWNIP